MKNLMKIALIVAIMVTSLLVSKISVAEDAEGCKDYPLFSRMKNFELTECEERDFDEVEIYIGEDETVMVEGHKIYLGYSVKEEVKPPSALQIKRNYVNAANNLGGTQVYEEAHYVSGKVVKEGREIWFVIRVYGDGDDYDLTIVETGEMAQEVTAGEMLAALNKDGHIALYINFDTGKATIKPESEPIIDQIVALLDENPDLTVSIEGHTDDVGSAESNKTLSLQRANAVMDALIQKGIEAARLSAVGHGEEKPIAENTTEEGRAKNRRVEIVKK